MKLLKIFIFQVTVGFFFVSVINYRWWWFSCVITASIGYIELCLCFMLYLLLTDYVTFTQYPETGFVSTVEVVHEEEISNCTVKKKNFLYFTSCSAASVECFHSTVADVAFKAGGKFPISLKLCNCIFFFFFLVPSSFIF